MCKSTTTAEDAEATNDSDKTVIYDPPDNDNDAMDEHNTTATTRGTFTTRVIGLPISSKAKSKQTKFYCINCGLCKPTRGEVNKHYCESHPPVTCIDCKETFTTPDTLLRHRYIHRAVSKFDCDKCDK